MDFEVQVIMSTLFSQELGLYEALKFSKVDSLSLEHLRTRR